MTQFYIPPLFELIRSKDLNDHELIASMQSALDEEVEIFDLQDSDYNNALHYCIYYNRSLDVIKWLINLSPFSVYDRNNMGNHVLFAAVSFSSLDVISYLLHHFSDLVHQVNNNGGTIAHAAAVGHFIQEEPLATQCIPYINQPDYFGDLPIHAAAQAGNITAIKWLVAHGADLHARTVKDDLSVLEMATVRGNIELLDYLNDYFNLSTPTNNGFYPIQFAAMNHPNSLQWFLDQGFPANWKNDLNINLVHNAASYNIVENLELLKSKQVDINLPTANGWYPIHFAAQSGAVEAIDWFVKNGVDLQLKCKSEFDNTPLEIAVLNNQVDVLDYLLDKDVPISQPGTNNWYPIHLSIRQESYKAFVWLIDNGADINAEQEDEAGETPVICAVYSDDLSFLRTLALCGAEIDKPNRLGIYPIHMAAYTNTKSLKWLLDKGVSPNRKQATNEEYQPIHLTAIYGSPIFLDILHSYGANINDEDQTGLQPIHYAAKRTDLDGVVLQWFVDHGADVNAVAQKDFGNRPVHYAAIRDSVVNLEVLFAAKADIHKATGGGLYPLHLAAYHNNLRTVKWLLAHGAVGDQWEDNENGETPAHYAVQRGHVEVLELLFEHGFDVNKINKYQVTPFEQAVHLGNQHVIDWYFNKKIISKN
ncbi:ankyrin repeat domain-containing protein [Legionella quateirensis]|uniref:Ankyrin repeat protein n=1 Tax=Legionella quateirensis TaxID=45072 RepID=A0A378KRL0_9GAMM|nr:ankyrin repeat domain-containing protein [Legionella quateirensis]KTD53003.1 Ankyrin repeat protein [Legionella quateirensis]STY17223.1 Ankyrin repeat protein [Legionella quateirensis]